jgi:hypothetical protein
VPRAGERARAAPVSAREAEVGERAAAVEVDDELDHLAVACGEQARSPPDDLADGQTARPAAPGVSMAARPAGSIDV